MFHKGVRRSIVTLTALVFLAAGCGAAEEAADAEAIEDGLATTAPAESGSENELGSEPETDVETTPPNSTTELDLAAAERSALEFSQCIRDQGIDVADLTVGEDGQLDLANLIATVDTGDPAVQQAMLACQGSLNGGLAGSLNQILQSETFADALVSFSQCVRDEGYDVADLTFAAIVSATLGSGLDTSSGADPSTGGDSVAPILASAMGLDPQDSAVIETIDGCVVLIRNGLGDLGLGG